MSEYRFIAFPKGVAPTAKEVEAFRGYAEMLNDRVAFGKQRDEAGLAICCEAEPFDRLLGLDPKFAGLVKRWEKQGAQVVESLPFSRDKQPWRDIKSAEKPKKEPKAATPPKEKSLERKRADAQRAEAASLLAVDREKSRGQAYQRWAGVLPYAMWVAGGVGVLLAGVYVSGKLSKPQGESRAEAIERIADDAFEEPLGQQPAEIEQATRTEEEPADPDN